MKLDTKPLLQVTSQILSSISSLEQGLEKKKVKTSWLLSTVPKTNEKCLVLVNWFNLRMPYSKVLEGILHIIKISSSYNVTYVLVVVHLFPEKTNL